MRLKYIVYCGLVVIVIACSAAGFWLVVRNSPSHPTTSTTAVAPATSESAKPKETANAVLPQRVVPIAPAGPSSPNTIKINFIKEEGSPIKLERLEGLNIVLERDNANFVSTPIMTDDAAVRGTCRVIGVLPGTYSLKIPSLGISQKIMISAQDKPATIELTFRSGGMLVMRTLSEK